MSGRIPCSHGWEFAAPEPPKYDVNYNLQNELAQNAVVIGEECRNFSEPPGVSPGWLESPAFMRGVTYRTDAKQISPLTRSCTKTPTRRSDEAARGSRPKASDAAHTA